MKAHTEEQGVTDFSQGKRFSVDIWDVTIWKYRMYDEELSGVRCFTNFVDAKNTATRILMKKIENLQRKLLELEKLKVTEVV